MVVQLPLVLWLAISARSAALQPKRSSAMACLRVRGSSETLLIAKAQPVLRPHDGFVCGERRASNAAGCRERNGYSPSARLNGAREALRGVGPSLTSGDGGVGGCVGPGM
eukprot:6172717-Pleurochrysis_carterae.AAC.1